MFSSHILSDLLKFVDRILFISNGKIVRNITSTELQSLFGTEDLEKTVLAMPNVIALLDGKPVKKVIIVPNRLVNLIV